MAIATTTAILAATAVVGTAYSISKSQEAASAQRQAARTQQQMQSAQAARERRGAIRQALIARSTMQAEAAGMGLLGTSAYGGGRGSLGAQLGANLGYGSMMSGLGRQYTGFTAQAATYQSQAAMGSAISGLAMQALPYADQIGQFVSGLTPAPSGSPLGGGGK